MGKQLVFASMLKALTIAVLITGAVLSHEAYAFNEAPMLAAKVKNGTLPEIAKRLPEHPAVVKPFDRPGKYGGVWRRAYTGLSDLVGARRVFYDPLVRWSPDYRVIPNLATKWAIEEGRKKSSSFI